MTQAYWYAGGRRLRALALLAVLVGACDSTERLANTDPTDVPPAQSDSDSLAAADPTVIAETFASTPGIPFGPFALWSSYTSLKSSSIAYTSSFNAINADGIISRIRAARDKRQRLFLFMTPGFSAYMTNGRFDIYKWKQKMNTYKRSDIRAAVAAGIADGTILGNSVLDEPNTSKWGGRINKYVLDQMCSYVKGIFPGLPAGAAVVHWWRPTERYRVCDFIIDQWAWWQGPNGPGAGAYTGNVGAWKTAALSQARKDGIAIAFSLNLLNGGIQNWSTKKCPIPLTGGYGTRTPACRMTADQVKNWGLALGPSGCAMLMWRFDGTFMSKSANISAIKTVLYKLASSSKRSCRRPG